MYKRKTCDEYVIEGRYEGGWETVTTELTMKEARERLREYRENTPQYPHRLRKYRVPIRAGA